MIMVDLPQKPVRPAVWKMLWKMESEMMLSSPRMPAPAAVRRRLATLEKHIEANAPPPVVPRVGRAASTAGAEGGRPRTGLGEIDRYWFETQGYVVVKGALSEQQVQACNSALEEHRDLVRYSPLSEDGRGWVVPPPL